jgi:DNA-binding transcriptional regulator YdaS (Cro superfamily)
MDLKRYLSQPGAMSAAELARRIGVEGAQVRQWAHGYAGRRAGPANCVAIEDATNGAVMRWDLRPEDWHLIWPELVGRKGAPKVRRVAA